MAHQYTKWERYFQRLNILFHAIVAISMIPFAWAFLETQKEFPDDPILSGSFALALKFGLILAALGLIWLAVVFKRRDLQSAHSPRTLEGKLDFFRSVYLKYYLILELAGMLAFVGLYLLKDQFFSFLYVGVLFVFSQARPTYDRVVSEAALGTDDQEALKAKE